MRAIVTCLPGKLAGIYLKFKRFGEIIHMYEGTREKAH